MMGVEDEVLFLARRNEGSIHRPTDPDGLVLEAWAQGFMVGTLLFMVAITIANMRRRVLLHKLILAEVGDFPYGVKSRSNANRIKSSS